MRQLIYYVATTIDHYIAREDGSIEGFLPEGDHIPAFLDSLHQFGGVLMGKHTYEFGYQYGLEKGQPAYADFPDLKNYIFSKSIDIESSERVEVVREDAIAFVKKLKQEQGKDLWLCGGGKLAGAMLEAELIDQLIIKINPVVFGAGIPLFGGSKKSISLDLFDSRIYNSGAVFLSYSIHY